MNELEEVRLSIQKMKDDHEVMMGKMEDTANYIKENAGNISKEEMDKLLDDLIDSI